MLVNKKGLFKSDSCKSKQVVSSHKSTSNVKVHTSHTKSNASVANIDKKVVINPISLDFINRQALECDVCGEIGITPLLNCKACRVSVHSLCYSGCSESPREWLCDRCDYFSGKLKSVKCTVCTYEEGAFKKTFKSVISEAGGKLDNFMHYDSGL